MPNKIRSDPKTTRNQDAQAGGDLCRPPSAPDAAMDNAVNAARLSTQPPRKARLLGRGRGACKTSTAGMIDSGESEMTSANPMTAVSTVPKLSPTGSNHRIDDELWVAARACSWDEPHYRL